MVGQDAQRHVGVGVGAVADPGDLLGHGQDGPEDVGLEERLHPLEHGEVALEPGPGVDALAGQVGQGAVGQLVVLHEHQVVDLDEALRAAVGGPAVLAVGGAAVEEQLRRRATGAQPAVAHLPEVVLAHAWTRRSGTRAASSQISLASSSDSCTVTHKRSASTPRTSVSSSQARGMASDLK